LFGERDLGVLQDSSFLQQVDPRLARPFLEGFAESIDAVFLAGGFVMVLAFVTTWFIKEIPLRTTTQDLSSTLHE
jgi:hypothetical protein